MAVMQAMTDRRLTQRMSSLRAWTPQEAFDRLKAAWGNIAAIEAAKEDRRLIGRKHMAELRRKRGG